MKGMQILPAAVLLGLLTACQGEAPPEAASPAEMTQPPGPLEAQGVEELDQAVERLAKALPTADARALREAVTLIAVDVMGAQERVRTAINPLEMAHAYYRVCLREGSKELLERLSGKTFEQIVAQGDAIRQEIGLSP